MMNGEEVFSIQHICVQLVLINVYSFDGLSVIWKQNTIFRRNNIVLNVKFHFAGELSAENVWKPIEKKCNIFSVRSHLRYLDWTCNLMGPPSGTACT